MKTVVVWFTGLFFSLIPAGCGSQGGGSDDGEATPAIRTTSQSLTGDAARARVLQEASYAMTGDYNRYVWNPWPEGETLARHAYTSSWIGAWNTLVSVYGQATSCKGSWTTYSPCYLSYGANQMPYYTCQGYCPTWRYRGGQCKAFVNLVAYRSGQYIHNDGRFKTIKSDWEIDGWPSTAEQMPWATYQNIKPGDVLRRTTKMGAPHALIIARVISPSRVIVVDSNWIGGPGNEVVGSHEMSFSGSGTVSDLGTYRVLKCMYNASSC